MVSYFQISANFCRHSETSYFSGKQNQHCGGGQVYIPVCKNHDKKTQMLDVHASFGLLGVGMMVKQKERNKHAKGHSQCSKTS